MIVRKMTNWNRCLEIYDSIRDPWIEFQQNRVKLIVTFGAKNGIAIYEFKYHGNTQGHRIISDIKQLQKKIDEKTYS